MLYYQRLLHKLNASSFVQFAQQSIINAFARNKDECTSEATNEASSNPDSSTIQLNYSQAPTPVEIISFSDDDDDGNNDDSYNEEAMYKSNPNLFLYHNNKLAIYKNDLDCLKPGEWLNDSIMEFYYTELQQAALNKKGTSSVYISNPFFFSKLVKESEKDNNLYTATKSWMKNVDIFEKKLWLIPVCENNHWYLIVVANLKGCIRGRSRKKCRIFVLDSLNLVSLKRVNLIVRFLKCAAKTEEFDFVPPIKRKLEVPQQNNCYDCGLYVLCFIKTILDKPSIFYKIKGESLQSIRWKKKRFPTRQEIFSHLIYLRDQRLSYLDHQEQYNPKS